MKIRFGFKTSLRFFDVAKKKQDIKKGMDRIKSGQLNYTDVTVKLIISDDVTLYSSFVPPFLFTG